MIVGISQEIRSTLNNWWMWFPLIFWVFFWNSSIGFSSHSLGIWKTWRHAAWLKVNRLTGRRVLKARWGGEFHPNVISCPATTVQFSQGFGARLRIILFAHILLMLFGCFAMDMLIYNDCLSHLSTLFTHFHFQFPAGERTLSLQRVVMIDCRVHSCCVFFGGGVMYFLAADRQITWRRASRTKDRAACSKNTNCVYGWSWELLGWIENRWQKYKTGWSTELVDFLLVLDIFGPMYTLAKRSYRHLNTTVFQIVHLKSHHHSWATPSDTREMMGPWGTQLTYQTLQLHLRYSRILAWSTLIIPDPSIFSSG